MNEVLFNIFLVCATVAVFFAAVGMAFIVVTDIIETVGKKHKK
jgi:hypothetical protein